MAIAMRPATQAELRALVGGNDLDLIVPIYERFDNKHFTTPKMLYNWSFLPLHLVKHFTFSMRCLPFAYGLEYGILPANQWNTTPSHRSQGRLDPLTFIINKATWDGKDNNGEPGRDGRRKLLSDRAADVAHKNTLGKTYDVVTGGVRATHPSTLRITVNKGHPTRDEYETDVTWADFVVHFEAELTATSFKYFLPGEQVFDMKERLRLVVEGAVETDASIKAAIDQDLCKFALETMVERLEADAKQQWKDDLAAKIAAEKEEKKAEEEKKKAVKLHAERVRQEDLRIERLLGEAAEEVEDEPKRARSEKFSAMKPTVVDELIASGDTRPDDFVKAMFWDTKVIELTKSRVEKMDDEFLEREILRSARPSRPGESFCDFASPAECRSQNRCTFHPHCIRGFKHLNKCKRRPIVRRKEGPGF